MKTLCSFGSKGCRFSCVSHLKGALLWSHPLPCSTLLQETFHSGPLDQKIRKQQGIQRQIWVAHLIMEKPQELRGVVLTRCAFITGGGLRPGRIAHGSSYIQFWSLKHKKYMELLKWVQRRSTKMTRGLEQFSYDDRVTESEFFHLEDRSSRKTLLNTFSIWRKPIGLLEMDEALCKNICRDKTMCNGSKPN